MGVCDSQNSYMEIVEHKAIVYIFVGTYLWMWSIVKVWKNIHSRLVVGGSGDVKGTKGEFYPYS